MNKSIMIVAAEASSSHYALKLMRVLKAQDPELEFFGAGSKEMEDFGFERFGKSEEMAVVGASEIFKHFGHLKMVFYSLLEEVKKRKPRFVILMDYPEFNLYLSRKIFPLGVPCFYYISPQVWAWRQGRVQTIKKFCKKVFLLFPFEVDFYSKHLVPYEFVGHPLLDELDQQLIDPGHLQTIRNQRGISKQEIVLGLMPGSRRGEIEKLFAIQLEVASRLYRKIPNLKVLIMVAPSVQKEDLHPYLNDMKIPFMMIKDDPFRMIAMSDYVLAASGTATLMVGLLEKPMVVMYKMSKMTELFVKAFVRGVRYFCLVNLILKDEVVPERMQSEANSDVLEKLLFDIMTSPERTEHIRSQLRQLKLHLGEKGATDRVAKSLQEYLQ
ncbi:MAG: lipid-A-disaccharide synthase [Pseudobdellovibrionaceae bacterium]